MGENSRGGSGLLLYAGEAGGLDCFQDRMIPCRACARRHQRLVGWMLEDRGWDSLDWTHVKEQIFLRPGRNGMWHWLRCRAGRLPALKEVIYTFLHVHTCHCFHFPLIVLLLFYYYCLSQLHPGFNAASLYPWEQTKIGERIWATSKSSGCLSTA